MKIRETKEEELKELKRGRLFIQSDRRWSAWVAGRDFEIGSDFTEDLKWYDYNCQMSLVRRAEKLDGLQLIFLN